MWIVSLETTTAILLGIIHTTVLGLLTWIGINYLSVEGVLAEASKIFASICLVMWGVGIAEIVIMAYTQERRCQK